MEQPPAGSSGNNFSFLFHPTMTLWRRGELIISAEQLRKNAVLDYGLKKYGGKFWISTLMQCQEIQIEALSRNEVKEISQNCVYNVVVMAQKRKCGMIVMKMRKVLVIRAELFVVSTLLKLRNHQRDQQVMWF